MALLFEIGIILLAILLIFLYAYFVCLIEPFSALAIGFVLGLIVAIACISSDSIIKCGANVTLLLLFLLLGIILAYLLFYILIVASGRERICHH